KSGGGREKRIYTISLTQNVEKENGLFTIINRYSKLKVNPSFKHIVHGNYGCENALIDAIEQNDARALLASLSLFNHIKNWSKLYSLAKERKLRKIVGALYDVSREAIKTNKMPNKTYELMLNSDDIKQINFETKKEHFKEIKDRWNINIPFSEEDLKRIRG
ncbi:MAG: hypothetical protein Q8O89_05610, partial [Nanoarchaeota archaeon]|nr:hypothetical protein [Nanoarchaeota archaeon]